MKELSPEYHAQVSRGFDALAKGYDGAFPGSLSLERMRSAASRALARLAKPGETWLELGCGTGRDAAEMARRGVRVLATDPSPGMIDQVHERVSREGLAGAVIPRRLGTPELAELLPEWEGKFDGAAGLFGAFNYDPSPARIPPLLARLLKPGAPVAAGVRNRVCPWEVLDHLLRHPSPRLAFRRFMPGGAPTRLGPVTAPTFAFTPGEFGRLFRPSFRVESVEGLCVALPPYMQERSGRAPWWERALALLEPAAARAPLLRALGDHFLMVLRRGE